MSGSELVNPEAVQGHNEPPSPIEIKLESLRAKPEFLPLFEEAERIADKAEKVRKTVDRSKPEDEHPFYEIRAAEECEPFIEVAKAANKLSKKLDETRKDHDRPIQEDLKLTKQVVDSFVMRMDRVADVFGKMIGDFDERQRREEQRRRAEEADRLKAEADAKMKEAEESQHSIMGDVALQEAADADQKAREAEAAVQGAMTGPTRMDAGTISGRRTWVAEIVSLEKIDLNKLRSELGTDVIKKALDVYARKYKEHAKLDGVRFYESKKTVLR